MSLYKINIEDTYQIKGKKKWYDMNQCLAFVLERGIAIYGNHFFMSLYQKEVFYKLIAYAIEDIESMNYLKISANKGLLLMGDPKTGKTAYFRLIQYFFHRRRNYIIKNSRLIAHEFATTGYEAFDPIFAPHAKALCLDNIGREQTVKYYGATCDVVQNIVEHFYEQRFDLPFPRLHITTALSPTELEKKYGKGFRAMLQDMFNVIICE